MLAKKDYYEILGLSKGTASDDSIKQAYRKLALKFHPDRNRAPSSTPAFQKLGQAYACLSDPQSKANYDRFGSEEQYRQQYKNQAHFYRDDFNADDIFRMFFNDQGGGGDLNDLLGGLFMQMNG